eukprot:3260598-Rhodomonas_salina.1
MNAASVHACTASIDGACCVSRGGNLDEHDAAPRPRRPRGARDLPLLLHRCQTRPSPTQSPLARYAQWPVLTWCRWFQATDTWLRTMRVLLPSSPSLDPPPLRSVYHTCSAANGWYGVRRVGYVVVRWGVWEGDGACVGFGCCDVTVGWSVCWLGDVRC